MKLKTYCCCIGSLEVLVFPHSDTGDFKDPEPKTQRNVACASVFCGLVFPRRTRTQVPFFRILAPGGAPAAGWTIPAGSLEAPSVTGASVTVVVDSGDEPFFVCEYHIHPYTTILLRPWAYVCIHV